jgi:hypothetical protein
MEKLKNLGIAFFLYWLHWKNFSWQHWMFFFRLFTFSSALVIVLSDSPCERIAKWETCPILKRTDRWCAFNWSICDKNCHVVRCSESDSVKCYVGIHVSWEDNISEEEEWPKIKIDRKISPFTEENIFFFFSKNHITTVAQVTAELNIHLEVPVCTKTVRRWVSQIQHPR